MSSERNILIVEDNPELSYTYEMMLYIAQTNVQSELESKLNINIFRAFHYEDAISIIEKENIDFLSIDLALQEQDQNLKDIDRKQGRDPGGIQILKYLLDKGKCPIIIIMSGETLMSYATDTLQKYGVFAYFQKSNDEENYARSLQIVLWYLEANELISKIEDGTDFESISLAEKHWEHAKNYAEKIGRVNFPSNLDFRIANIKSNLDPIAKVPGNSWTESILRQRIFGTGKWTLIKFQIINYNSFIASQASQIGPLLTYMVNTLKASCVKVGFPETYVGVWRGADLIGPCVLAVFSENTSLAHKIAEIVSNNFREKAQFFTDNFEISLPKPEFSYMIWDEKNNKDKFGDWPQLVDDLSKFIK